jgi:hypothetical protein
VLAVVELVLGLFKGALDAGSFSADGGDLVAELVLGPAFVGGEVEEVAFLGVKLLKSFVEFVAHGCGEGVAVGCGSTDGGLHVLLELPRDRDGVCVVPDHGLFHGFDGDVGMVADAGLPASTEEVVVDLAVPVFGALDDEALFAAGAEDGAFEVVGVAALPGAGAAVGVEYLLDPVKMHATAESSNQRRMLIQFLRILTPCFPRSTPRGLFTTPEAGHVLAGQGACCMIIGGL